MTKNRKVRLKYPVLKRILSQATETTTLKDIAKRARISPYWLYSVNQGKTFIVAETPVERLADALEVHISDIARPYSENKRHFGRYLRRIRQNRHIKAVTVARVLDLDSPTYCRLEKGQRRPPNFDGILKIARALDLGDKETGRLVQLANHDDFLDVLETQERAENE